MKFNGKGVTGNVCFFSMKSVSLSPVTPKLRLSNPLCSEHTAYRHLSTDLVLLLVHRVVSVLLELSSVKD